MMEYDDIGIKDEDDVLEAMKAGAYAEELHGLYGERILGLLLCALDKKVHGRTRGETQTERTTMKIKAFTALCVYPADQIEDVSGSSAAVMLRLANGDKRTIHLPVATNDYEDREAFVAAMSGRAGDLWDTAQSLESGERVQEDG